MAAIARAAASIALRPSCGRMPACAALPRKVASIRKYVGEATTTSPIGEAWSRTKPNSDRSCETSNSLAPASAFSSETVKSSSTPTGEPSMATRCASASITATAALLSAPRIASLRFVQPPSSTTGSIGTSPCGTVSRCAQSRIERSDRPGIRANRLPAFAPTSAPAPSSPTSMPSPRSSAATRSAHARSRPNGDGIAHSSANRSFSRRRSTSEAGRTTGCATRGSRPRRPPVATWRGPSRPRRTRGTAGRDSPGAT